MPRLNDSTRFVVTGDDKLLRKPTIGFGACCARAASDHARDEEATALIKSRRRIAFSEAQDCADLRLQLQQGFATDEMGFWVSLHGCNPEPLMSGFGSKADIGARLDHVRFTPKSGHWLSVSGCPLCAKSRLMHRSKKEPYSITSSAVASNDEGMVRSSSLAVLRLITSSNLTGPWTGSSLGFSPLRIRSA
jgi:hypothetical protein